MTRIGSPLLEVQGLRTQFRTREGVVHSVDGVDLTIRAGETLCVVGESGCGKSVTARSIMQLVDAPGKIVEGSVRFRPRPDLDLGPAPRSGLRRLWHRDSTPTRPLGADGVADLAQLPANGPALRAIRGNEISMIFQEPMAALSPVHTIGAQLVETLLLHEKLSPAEAKDRAIDALDRVGIPTPQRRFDSYSFELSGGMRQRAMIAMAIVCGPQLLIADEPTTALDVTTQRQILGLMRRMQDEHGMAIMFITHDLGVVAEIADRVAVMYLGTVVETCDVYQLFDSPRHPYTQALLQSVPDLAREQRNRLSAIRGTVPHPLNRPSGCPFSNRCDHRIDGCTDVLPPMIPGAEPGGAEAGGAGAGDARAVRCLHFPEPGTVASGIGRDLIPLPTQALLR